MKTTEEVLTAALDAMRRRGWTKWMLTNGAGQVCARGACGLAITGNAFSWRTEDNNEVDSLLARVVQEQYPDRVKHSVMCSHYSCDCVPYFNNHEDTTFEDVERVFEKAIVKAGELD